MKIQARIGAFETNSSTNHTLCIVKPGAEKRLDDSFHEKVPQTVNIPCFTGEDAIKKLDELEYAISGKNLGDLSLDAKVTLVIASSLDSKASDFIEKISIVQEILENNGIGLSINWNALEQLCQAYWDDGISCILDEMNRDELAAFLFSDDARYALWCDEGCCPPPDEYSELIDKIESLSKERPDDIIVLNNRC